MSRFEKKNGGGEKNGGELLDAPSSPGISVNRTEAPTLDNSQGPNSLFP